MTKVPPKPGHTNGDHGYDQRHGCSLHLESATVDRGQTDGASLSTGSPSLGCANFHQPSPDDRRVGRRGFGLADQSIERGETIGHVVTMAIVRTRANQPGARSRGESGLSNPLAASAAEGGVAKAADQ
jgi:hypothetical protein